MEKSRNIHIICGEDSFRKDIYLRELLAREAPEENRDFDYERLEGRSLFRGIVTSRVNTPPLMAPSRVLHVEEAENIKAEVIEEIASVLAVNSGPRDFILIAVYSAGKKPSKELTALAINTASFGELKWKEACDWVVRRASEHHGYKLPADIAKEIVGAVGASDSGILANELDKLLSLAEGKITKALIQEVTGTRVNDSIYDLCDNLGLRQSGRAQQITEALLRKPEYNGISILIYLAKHLGNVGLVKALLAGGEAQTHIKKRMGWTADKLLSQAQKWELPEIDYALCKLADIDLLLKSGGNEYTLLTGYILDVSKYNNLNQEYNDDPNTR